MPASTLSQNHKRKIYGLIILSIILILPFLYFSNLVGIMGFTKGLKDNHPSLVLNPSGWMPTNYSLSLHMILGAVVTGLAPIQVLLGWTKKGLKAHRIIGYIFFIAAILTGIGGLFYTLIEETTGGIVMNIGFGLYGSLVIIAALQTLRYARNKQMVLHEEWSLRLFVLAMASWFYRMCYGFWLKLNGSNVGHTENFQGPFDYFMDFAFFIPPLLILEFYFRKIKTTTSPVNPLVASILVLGIAAFLIIGFLGFYGQFLD